MLVFQFLVREFPLLRASTMTEPFSSRKRPLEHISEEEEKSTPKKKVVARDCIILLTYSCFDFAPRAGRRDQDLMKKSSPKHPTSIVMVNTSSSHKYVPTAVK